MTLEQLRTALAAARTKLHELREQMTTAQRAIDAASDPTPEELTSLRTAFDEAAAAFDEQAEEVTRVKGNLEAEEARQRVLDENPAPARAAAVPHVSTVEPPVYSEHSSASFFTDAYRHQFNADSHARERLERHGRQVVDEIQSRGIQQRDVGTGAFSGLTVPQYLIDLYAPLARAGAPLLAAIARKLPLPETGMTLNVSRLTTGTEVEAQSSENTAATETDSDDTLLTINIRAYTGQQDVSRQALERSELVDVVVFQDLIADYFTRLDSAIINADGTSGTHLGIRSTTGKVSVTYTDASPTVPEMYPKEADAIQQIATSVYKPAQLIVMHPRRWGWNTASLDSSNRPLVVPDSGGPFNALGVGDAPEYGAIVGTKHGLPVLTDANIPTTLGAGTNEDVELILRTIELLFWQDGDGNPRQFRFEQANAPQSVRLAVWGYSAFTAGRYPGASAVIGGTGLAAPTF